MSVAPLIAVVSALAVLLVVVGLRGRRLGTALYCRRCRFALAGLDRPAACPECGRSVNDPKAVQIGLRVRRRGALVLGSVLLLVCAALLGTVLVGNAKGVNWNMYKPVWWLTSDLESSDPKRAEPAAAELAARFVGGMLSTEAAAKLLGRALEMHSDTSRPWVGPLDTVIAHSIYHRRLTREQFKVYLQHLASPVLGIAGDELPWEGDKVDLTVKDNWRAGRISSAPGPLYPRTFMVVTEFRVAHGTATTQKGILRMPQATAPGYEFAAISAPASPGKHTIRGTLVYRPHLGAMAASAGQAGVAFDESAYQDIVGEYPVTVTVDVVPSGHGLPVLVKDSSLEEPIRASVKSLHAVLSVDKNGRAMGSVWLDAGPAPCGLAFQVLWRKGERDWKIRDVGGIEGAAWGGNGGNWVDGFAGETVDVVLRTDAMNIKTRRSHFKEVWDGEIVFKDVPVEPYREGEPFPPFRKDER